MDARALRFLLDAFLRVLLRFLPITTGCRIVFQKSVNCRSLTTQKNTRISSPRRTCGVCSPRLQYSACSRRSFCSCQHHGELSLHATGKNGPHEKGRVWNRAQRTGQGLQAFLGMKNFYQRIVRFHRRARVPLGILFAIL